MSSTSLSGGNLVDGLPPVSSWQHTINGQICNFRILLLDMPKFNGQVQVEHLNSTQAVNRHPGFRLKDS